MELEEQSVGALRPDAVIRTNSGSKDFVMEPKFYGIKAKISTSVHLLERGEGRCSERKTFDVRRELWHECGTRVTRAGRVDPW